MEWTSHPGNESFDSAVQRLVISGEWMIRDFVGAKKYYSKKGHCTTRVCKITMFFFSVFGSELLSPISAPPVQFSSNTYCNLPPLFDKNKNQLQMPQRTDREFVG
jgi:hypothetical protein